MSPFFSWLRSWFEQPAVQQPSPSFTNPWLPAQTARHVELEPLPPHSLTPTRLPYQPLPLGPATTHAANANAALRLILRAHEPRKLRKEGGLERALQDEALGVASFVLSSAAAPVVLARQPCPEDSAQHPFIRVCVTARDLQASALPLTLYVFEEVEYPPRAVIEMNSIISVWIPGFEGPQMIGCVTSMQPAKNEQVLFHLDNDDRRFVCFLLGPERTAYEPDRLSQALNYRQDPAIARLPEMPPLPLPPRSDEFLRLARVGDLLQKLEGEQRATTVPRRKRSRAAINLPPIRAPPPSAKLPPTPRSARAPVAPRDADSAVSTLSHPPHTETSAGL